MGDFPVSTNTLYSTHDTDLRVCRKGHLIVLTGRHLASPARTDPSWLPGPTTYCEQCAQEWLAEEFRLDSPSPEVWAAYRLGGLEAAEAVVDGLRDETVTSTTGRLEQALGRTLSDSERAIVEEILKS